MRSWLGIELKQDFNPGGRKRKVRNPGGKTKQGLAKPESMLAKTTFKMRDCMKLPAGGVIK